MSSIVIRVDSSRLIGTGHVVRMLVLAKELRYLSCPIIFVCKDHEGSIASLIESSGFPVLRINTLLGGPDAVGYAAWLGSSEQEDYSQFKAVTQGVAYEIVIVDHYSIGAAWHALARRDGIRLVAIDDIGERQFDVDLLVNQNLGINASSYDSLTVGSPKLLLGPKYAMVGGNYLSARRKLKRNYYNSHCLRVFVFMGGIDKDNFTTAVLRILQSSRNLDRIFFNVVVGLNYSYLDDLNNLIKNSLSTKAKIYRGLPSLEKIISQSDIGIASGGSNTWERCCLGMPSIVIPVAANQAGIANEISKFGVSETVEIENLSKIDCIFDAIISSPKNLNRMSKKAMCLVDGLGAGRVAREILCIK